MISDPIADFLFRIKNAYLVDKETVEIPYSKMKEKLAEILVKEGFVEKIKIETLSGNKKFKAIKAILKYENKKPALTHVKRISKPGVRIYAKKDRIPRVLSGLGTVILSTPKGLMVGKEARKRGLGGEMICEIW